MKFEQKAARSIQRLIRGFLERKKLLGSGLHSNIEENRTSRSTQHKSFYDPEGIEEDFPVNYTISGARPQGLLLEGRQSDVFEVSSREYLDIALKTHEYSYRTNEPSNVYSRSSSWNTNVNNQPVGAPESVREDAIKTDSSSSSDEEKKVFTVTITQDPREIVDPPINLHFLIKNYNELGLAVKTKLESVKEQLKIETSMNLEVNKGDFSIFDASSDESFIGPIELDFPSSSESRVSVIEEHLQIPVKSLEENHLPMLTKKVPPARKFNRESKQNLRNRRISYVKFLPMRDIAKSYTVLPGLLSNVLNKGTRNTCSLANFNELPDNKNRELRKRLHTMINKTKKKKKNLLSTKESPLRAKVFSKFAPYSSSWSKKLLKSQFNVVFKDDSAVANKSRLRVRRKSKVHGKNH